MKNVILVSQGGHAVTTVQYGKVPVINIEGEGAVQEAIMAVNFLRSGCPKVQLVIANEPEAPSIVEEMTRFMLTLQLPEEKFYLFGKPKNVNGGQTVLIFSDKYSKAEELSAE